MVPNKQQLIVLGVAAVGLFLTYRYSKSDMVRGVATVVAGLVMAKQVPVLNQAAA